MTHHHDDETGPVNAAATSPMPFLDRVYGALAHQLPQHIDELGGLAKAAAALYGEGLGDTFRRVAGRLADTVHVARSDLVYAQRDHADEVTRLTERLALADETRQILETGITDARRELAAARSDANTRLGALRTIRDDVEDLRLTIVGLRQGPGTPDLIASITAAIDGAIPIDENLVPAGEQGDGTGPWAQVVEFDADGTEPGGPAIPAPEFRIDS